jgi:hypothetical protein
MALSPITPTPQSTDRRVSAFVARLERGIVKDMPTEREEIKQMLASLARDPGATHLFDQIISEVKNKPNPNNYANLQQLEKLGDFIQSSVNTQKRQIKNFEEAKTGKWQNLFAVTGGLSVASLIAVVTGAVAALPLLVVAFLGSVAIGSLGMRQHNHNKAMNLQELVDNLEIFLVKIRKSQP